MRWTKFPKFSEESAWYLLLLIPVATFAIVYLLALMGLIRK